MRIALARYANQQAVSRPERFYAEFTAGIFHEFISQDEARFEDVITDLEISKKSVAFEQERAEQYRREAETLKQEVERQKEKTRDACL